MTSVDVDALADAVAARLAPAALAAGELAAGELVNADGAAALLSVPASWVRAEARADRIPHVRLGRYVRFDRDELRAWWQERRRGPWRTGCRPVSGGAVAPVNADDLGRAPGRDTAGATNGR